MPCSVHILSGQYSKLVLESIFCSVLRLNVKGVKLVVKLSELSMQALQSERLMFFLRPEGLM